MQTVSGNKTDTREKKWKDYVRAWSGFSILTIGQKIHGSFQIQGFSQINEFSLYFLSALEKVDYT